jgi:hypothetical protein
LYKYSALTLYKAEFVSVRKPAGRIMLCREAMGIY